MESKPMDDFVTKMLKANGYTSPGQPMNVATAESFIRQAMMEAQRQEQQATIKRCQHCKDRYDSERRVF